MQSKHCAQVFVFVSVCVYVSSARAAKNIEILGICAERASGLIEGSLVPGVYCYWQKRHHRKLCGRVRAGVIARLLSRLIGLKKLWFATAYIVRKRGEVRLLCYTSIARNKQADFVCGELVYWIVV